MKFFTIFTFMITALTLVPATLICTDCYFTFGNDSDEDLLITVRENAAQYGSDRDKLENIQKIKPEAFFKLPKRINEATISITKKTNGKDHWTNNEDWDGLRFWTICSHDLTKCGMIEVSNNCDKIVQKSDTIEVMRTDKSYSRYIHVIKLKPIAE